MILKIEYMLLFHIVWILALLKVSAIKNQSSNSLPEKSGLTNDDNGASLLPSPTYGLENHSKLKTASGATKPKPTLTKTVLNFNRTVTVANVEEERSRTILSRKLSETQTISPTKTVAISIQNFPASNLETLHKEKDLEQSEIISSNNSSEVKVENYNKSVVKRGLKYSYRDIWEREKREKYFRVFLIGGKIKDLMELYGYLSTSGSELNEKDLQIDEPLRPLWYLEDLKKDRKKARDFQLKISEAAKTYRVALSNNVTVNHMDSSEINHNGANEIGNSMGHEKLHKKAEKCGMRLSPEKLKEMCNQENKLKEKLFCGTSSFGQPFLFLKPLKFEIFNLDPKVILYYEIMTDSEKKILYTYTKNSTREIPTDDYGSITLKVNAYSLPIFRKNIEIVSGGEAKASSFMMKGTVVGYRPKTCWSYQNLLQNHRKENVKGRYSGTLWTVFLNTADYGGTLIFPGLNTTLEPVPNSALRVDIGNVLKFASDAGYYESCPSLLGNQWILLQKQLNVHFVEDLTQPKR